MQEQPELVCRRLAARGPVGGEMDTSIYPFISIRERLSAGSSGRRLMILR